MESRNVKVIDEHSIDRDAYVICGISLDGSDYVLYSIERDGDNDNLFVSKIVKNIDGTSNMVNIEDSMEKNKVNEVVKELITYSIKNESDRTTGTVTLANGVNVTISGVLFNKEQNINVGKTYVTTVKKSVTKVSEDFYKVELAKKEENNSVFDTVTSEVEVPKVEETPSPAEEGVANVDEVKSEESVPAPLPSVEPVLPEVTPAALPSVEVSSVESELPKVEEPKVEPVLGPVVPEPAVEPILPVSNPVPAPLPSAEPILPVESELPKAEEPKVEPVLGPVVPEPAVEPILSVSNPVPEADPLIAPEPVLKVVPPVAEQPVAPESPEPVQEEQKLFFDGSEEVNLNRALDEVSNEKTMATQEDGVTSLREFGVDGPAVSAPTVSEPVESTAKVLTKSKGFANNKFFVVMAIVIFIGACVFLGYEAFNYFKLIK